MTLPQVDVSQLDLMQDSAGRAQFVGNSIFASISQVYGQELAPRLTGMLLDENAVNFKSLVTDSSYLYNKCQEAYTLLMSTQQQPPQQQ